MATYRQTLTFYEDGYGDVTVDIILADSYDNIFTSTYYETNIFDFDGVDKKLENAIGQLVTDESTFEVDESTFKMNDDNTIIADSKTQLDIDNEALTLCKTSSTSSLHYIGIFFNTSATPVFDDAIAIGAIDSDYEEEHLLWNGDDYDTARTPLKKYKFKTIPVQEALFDAVSLQDVIDAKEATFKAAAVVNNAGYEVGDYKAVVPYLVSIDAILRHLATQYASLLSSNGFGSFTITFADCVLDGKFHPTRFNYPLANVLKGQFVAHSGSQGFFNAFEDYMDVYGNEGVAIQLVGENPVLNADTFHVPITNLIKVEDLTDYGFRSEVLRDTAEDYLWQNNPRVDDSFTNLLYALATDLGLMLEFVFTSQTNIEIRFLPKSQVEQSQLYIKDAEKANSKKFKLDKREEEKLPKGVSSHLSREGINEIIGNTLDSHTVEPTQKFQDGNNTPRSLVSISAPLWRIDEGISTSENGNAIEIINDDYWQLSKLNAPMIPYNTILYNTNTAEYTNNVPYNSVSFTTNLYMSVSKRSGESNVSSSYYTPVGMYRVKQDGENRDFYSLEDYRRAVNNLEQRAYGRELSLTVPYLMAFSDASNGAGADILNLTIGRKIVLDSEEFVVTGFKVSIKDWKVDIKLENTGRFNYENSSDTSDVAGKTSTSQSGDSSGEDAEVFTYTASGTITKGQLVSLKTATTVEASDCANTHYNRVVGVALRDALDTEGVSVQTSGKVDISDLSLGGSVNDAVFLRDASATVNLSLTQLTDKTGSEDYYLEVGRIVGSDVMKIDFKEGFILP